MAKGNHSGILRRFLLTFALLGLTGVFRLSAWATETAVVKAWPLVYHAKDEEAGTEELEIAWPLIDFRTTSERDPWLPLHFFSRYHDPVTDETRTAAGFNLTGYATREPDRWRFWASPLLWFGRSPGHSHNVILPFYAGMKSQSTSTDALFPLYYSRTSGHGENQGYFFIVWKGWREWRTGGGSVPTREEHFHVLPFFFSKSRQRGETPLNKKHALFPLYYASDRYEDPESMDKCKSSVRSGFYLVWARDSESFSHTNQLKEKNESFRVWPLFKTVESHTENGKADTTTDTSLTSLWPVFRHRTYDHVKNADGSERHEVDGRVFPVLFWGKDMDEKGARKQHFIAFPFYWDLTEGDESVRALIPVAVKIEDEDFHSLNLFGPMFTRIRHEKKDYTRYDVLFPFFMWRHGSYGDALRALPLFGIDEVTGKRRTGVLLWPLIRSDESVDHAGNSAWSALFGSLSEVLEHYDPERPDGELHQNAIPVFYRHRTGGRRETTVFPFTHTGFSRGHYGDSTTTGVGPWSLLYSDTQSTDPARRDRQILGGMVKRTTGDEVNDWRVLPLVSKRRSTGFNLQDRTRKDNRSLALLLGAYSASRHTSTSVADGAVTSECSEKKIPLMFNASHTESEAGESRDLAIMPLFRFSLFDWDSRPDGSGKWSFLNPVWSVSKGKHGDRVSKSFGGFCHKSERDVCGFRSAHVFYRIFRRTTNSRESSWELMPLAYGSRDIQGGTRFGLLGGLLGFEKTAEQSHLRCVFPIPLGPRRQAPTLTEAETVERAKRHLEYGLAYLSGRHPERALVELNLAEPAFNGNPGLYEALGDACANAVSRGERLDILESTLDEIEKFTSSYPVRDQLARLARGDVHEFYRKRAEEAYAKARELGGDSALLRRKVIRLNTAKKDTLRELYRQAMIAFPDDFSLQLDYAAWLENQEALQDDARKQLVRTKEAFPGSAFVRYRLLTFGQFHIWKMKPDELVFQDRLNDALEAARLPGDTPVYLPVYKTDWTPERDCRGDCVTFACKLINHAIDMETRDKHDEKALAWLEQLFALTTLDEFALLQQQDDQWRTYTPQFLTSRLFSILERLDRLDEMVGRVKKHMVTVDCPGEMVLWERELRRLERDASYLTEWRVTDASGKGDTSVTKVPLFETYVDLREVLTQADPGMAVCECELRSPDDRDAVFLLGFDERIRVELNGTPVFSGACRVASTDEFSVPVRLRKGINTLTLRLDNKRLAWGFFARIADADGLPIPGVTGGFPGN